MSLDDPSAMLGSLSPAAFMRRHWQKKPLLVRRALPGIAAPLPRRALFALAAQDGVESRLVAREGRGAAGWKVRHGPLRTLPPAGRPRWTLLVQGLDLHVPAAHELLQRFRFVPDARLDDVMLSWASDDGGVGPHVDSYDVFLVQVQGRRRWRWAPPGDGRLVDGLPLRILAGFRPAEEAVLEPGDLLYLPPGWGHEGTAVGECMTASVGFRAPAAGELARELLQRLGDNAEDERLYRDPRQPATAAPGAVPGPLLDFARAALERVLREPGALERALGELLSEPKPQVWFDPGRALPAGGVALDARTRMLYDGARVFVNGESYDAAGRDARLMRRLADARALSAAERERLSAGAAGLLAEWALNGWVRPLA